MDSRRKVVKIMNAYVKQMIDSRMEYLEIEEQEIEKDIIHHKDQVTKHEAKLKRIQEEKAALQENK